jgi:hypothetical protein
MQPLTDEQMQQAQSVFIGTAIAYEATRSPNPDVITFRVEKVVSGKSVEGIIKVNWIHGTFGMPGSLREFHRSYGKKIKVGILFQEAFPGECSVKDFINALTGEKVPQRTCTSDFIGKDSESELPWVMNAPCSEPYIMPVE